ncbi:MAG TPA: hypothetical protein PLW55_09670, partial [Leptospiraceae bacterium]|nr:hypothetical protein [Leptospiraceae bacterium]
MLEIVHRLQKNVFLVTLGAAVFLGFSLAYLLTNIIPFFISDSGSVQIASSSDRRPVEVDVVRPLQDFEGVITGNFIR